MRFLTALVFTLVFASPALADINQVEAREVARINNCTPTNVEVDSQTLGTQGKTVYRISCDVPKSKDDKSGPAANALLVQCDENMCTLMRPVMPDSK